MPSHSGPELPCGNCGKKMERPKLYPSCPHCRAENNLFFELDEFKRIIRTDPDTAREICEAFEHFREKSGYNSANDTFCFCCKKQLKE
jgi:hypothetical protein